MSRAFQSDSAELDGFTLRMLISRPGPEAPSGASPFPVRKLLNPSTVISTDASTQLLDIVWRIQDTIEFVYHVIPKIAFNPGHKMHRTYDRYDYHKYFLFNSYMNMGVPEEILLALSGSKSTWWTYPPSEFHIFEERPRGTLSQLTNSPTFLFVNTFLAELFLMPSLFRNRARDPTAMESYARRSVEISDLLSFYNEKMFAYWSSGASTPSRYGSPNESKDQHEFVEHVMATDWQLFVEAYAWLGKKYDPKKDWFSKKTVAEQAWLWVELRFAFSDIVTLQEDGLFKTGRKRAIYYALIERMHRVQCRALTADLITGQSEWRANFRDPKITSRTYPSNQYRKRLKKMKPLASEERFTRKN